MALVFLAWGATSTDPCWNPRSFSRAHLTYTKAEGGHDKPWFGRVWLNPPWSDPGEWIEWLIQHCAVAVTAGFMPEHEGMALVRNDPSTGWFERAWKTADVVIFLSERTRYYQLDEHDEVVACGTPEFSSVLFYWGPNAAHVLDVFESEGHLGRFLPTHERRNMAPDDTNISLRVHRVIRGELAAVLVARPGVTLGKARAQILEETPLDQKNIVGQAFDALTIGELIEHARADARGRRPTQRSSMTRPNGKRKGSVAADTPKPRRAKRSAKRKGANGKAAAPPGRSARRARPQDAPAEPSPPAESDGDAPVWPKDPTDRVKAVHQWLKAEKRADFQMGDLMTKFEISRQMARRTVMQMTDTLTLVGDGRAARYEVKNA